MRLRDTLLRFRCASSIRAYIGKRIYIFITHHFTHTNSLAPAFPFPPRQECALHSTPHPAQPFSVHTCDLDFFSFFSLRALLSFTRDIRTHMTVRECSVCRCVTAAELIHAYRSTSCTPRAHPFGALPARVLNAHQAAVTVFLVGSVPKGSRSRTRTPVRNNTPQNQDLESWLL